MCLNRRFKPQPNTQHILRRHLWYIFAFWSIFSHKLTGNLDANENIRLRMPCVGNCWGKFACDFHCRKGDSAISCIEQVESACRCKVGQRRGIKDVITHWPHPEVARQQYVAPCESRLRFLGGYLSFPRERSPLSLPPCPS